VPELPDLSAPALARHAALLQQSHLALTGQPLVAPGDDLARRLFEAPFVLLSHDTADDPLLTYGNRLALELFETDWTTLTATPSRLTAEAPLREERERLLARVREHGFIDDYAGIRISRRGRRFHIERATVWNLVDPDGHRHGQAAWFDSWTPLD